MTANAIRLPTQKCWKNSWDELPVLVLVKKIDKFTPEGKSLGEMVAWCEQAMSLDLALIRLETLQTHI